MIGHMVSHWESRLEVNKFLLFISRYRVGLFRRLREAATEKDIHKAARELIALVCTLKCIYLLLHFVLKPSKLEQFSIQYFSLHWSLDVGCFWINVAWIWGWRMGKYSGWGTCFTGLLPWSRSNRLLPVSWKLHTKETKSYSFSSRQISFQGNAQDLPSEVGSKIHNRHKKVLVHTYNCNIILFRYQALELSLMHLVVLRVLFLRVLKILKLETC